MDLIKDIGEFVKEDRFHSVSLKISVSGVTVNLKCTPSYETESEEIIPIYYDAINEFAYLPNDIMVNTFKPKEYGLDLKDIKLICEIMDYLEIHKEELTDLCSKLSW